MAEAHSCETTTNKNNLLFVPMKNLFGQCYQFKHCIVFQRKTLVVAEGNNRGSSHSSGTFHLDAPSDVPTAPILYPNLS